MADSRDLALARTYRRFPSSRRPVVVICIAEQSIKYWTEPNLAPIVNSMYVGATGRSPGGRVPPPSGASTPPAVPRWATHGVVRGMDLAGFDIGYRAKLARHAVTVDPATRPAE